MVKELYDQQMAKRWSLNGDAAQISVFFEEEKIENETYFKGIQQSVDNALKTASIEKKQEHARLWIDAVSRAGRVNIRGKRANIELNAIGVSGDFFQFHPQKMVSGTVFLEDNLMKDGVVIDEDTAWQLFGSSQVVGMEVMLGDVPHYITGVMEKPKGRLEEAAGLQKPLCFLSLDSLNKYGTVNGGFTYEIVLPNPVKGFGAATMQSVLGTQQEGYVMVENNTRFEILSLLGIIQKFGIRSMSFQEIMYPYWENIARAKEDILALCLAIKMMFLVTPVLFIFLSTVYFWKNKTWTVEKGFTWLKDKIYEVGSKRMNQKKEKQENEEISNHCLSDCESGF